MAAAEPLTASRAEAGGTGAEGKVMAAATATTMPETARGPAQGPAPAARPGPRPGTPCAAGPGTRRGGRTEPVPGPQAGRTNEAGCSTRRIRHEDEISRRRSPARRPWQIVVFRALVRRRRRQRRGSLEVDSGRSRRTRGFQRTNPLGVHCKYHIISHAQSCYRHSTSETRPHTNESSLMTWLEFESSRNILNAQTDMILMMGLQRHLERRHRFLGESDEEDGGDIFLSDILSALLEDDEEDEQETITTGRTSSRAHGR